MSRSILLHLILVLVLFLGLGALWYWTLDRNKTVVPQDAVVEPKNGEAAGVGATAGAGGPGLESPTKKAGAEGQREAVTMPEANKRPPIRMSGRVTREGKPIQATVIAMTSGSYQFAGVEPREVARMQTDAKGRFRLTTTARVALVAEAKGMRSGNWLWIRNPEPKDLIGLDLELCEQVAVSGRVVDAKGKGVPGAKVSSDLARPWIQNGPGPYDETWYRAFPPQSMGKSDDMGRFAGLVLQNGKRFFRARLDEQVARIEVERLDKQELRLQLAPMHSPKTWKVFGKVLDAKGRFLPDAKLRLTGRETYSDSNGNFEFQAQPREDRVFLYAIDDDSQITKLPLHGITQDTGPITIRLPLGHELSGIVTDSDGTPVAKAWVRIHGEPPLRPTISPDSELSLFNSDRSLTDEQGRFRLRSLQSREYLIAADQGSRFAALTTWAPNREIKLVLGRVQGRHVRFLGVLRDSLSGLPIEGAHVNAMYAHVDNRTGSWSSLSSSVSDAQGRYQVVGLTRAQYYISASHKLYASNKTQGRIYELGEHRIDLKLSPVRSLRVRVKDSAGKPAIGATLSAKDSVGRNCMFRTEFGSSSQARTGRDGSVFLHGLPAGLVELRIQPSFRQAPTLHKIDITEEQLHEIDVQLDLWPMKGAPRTYAVQMIDIQGKSFDLPKGCEIRAYETIQRMVSHTVCSWAAGKFESRPAGPRNRAGHIHKRDKAIAIVAASDKVTALEILIPGHKSTWLDVKPDQRGKPGKLRTLRAIIR